MSRPVIAGLVAAVVGYASSFAVVLAGLRAAGATEAQAASGLLALCVAMGLLSIVLAATTRMPITIAWSTPGAALLASAGEPSGGYPAALGAFAAAGLLIVLAGLWRPLARAIAAIPSGLASAMLAGVLLSLCLAPVHSMVELPWLTAPVIAVWALLTRFARPWAVPGALAAMAVAVAIGRSPDLAGLHLGPQLSFTLPHVTAGALVGTALPLFIVTMTSQNVTGMGVLASFGYRPSLRRMLTTTGAATALVAPFGGHQVNLGAITAALTAGPDAGPDVGRRWIASATNGAAYLVLGVLAGAATTLLSVVPPLLIEAVAGLALLGALAGAIAAAVADPRHREAATVTLVVSASGMTALGISAPFWGLCAGLALLGLARVRAARPLTAT
ncbi:benzoate/H(+) symporter BenE family transporter [Candidatus Solirubrobacter pratensis]|uniref:benzoate/H(+) symporter BenE family transporter n=1 Tax=Candidatus Solirubrobacter pratensis TaxID=1298857 RepID=UPI000485C6FC|nr:benzoate/H(+) symporter BenE family transporter [Candidatus Solirubrobacter pratensis]